MSKKPAPSQIQDRYIVRMPDGMRDRIAAAAKANNRSMNAEIVARLEASFDSAETALATNELVAMMAAINGTMNELKAMKHDVDAVHKATIKIFADNGVKMPKHLADKLKS